MHHLHTKLAMTALLQFGKSIANGLHLYNRVPMCNSRDDDEAGLLTSSDNYRWILHCISIYNNHISQQHPPVLPLLVTSTHLFTVTFKCIPRVSNTVTFSRSSVVWAKTRANGARTLANPLQ